MLTHLFQLGYERCLEDHGLVKTAQGWVAPAIGAALGSVAGPMLLPHLGSENQGANMGLGALMGAGVGLGGSEIANEFRKLREAHRAYVNSPAFRQQALGQIEAAIAKLDPYV